MKKYRLVEENQLRRLLEGNMIYEELCAQGVDNWIGSEFIHYPDIDEIEAELSKYDIEYDLGYILPVVDKINKEK